MVVVKKKLVNIIKEKGNSKYKNLLGKEKEAKREYSRNRYKNMKENASQKSVKNKTLIFLYCIKLSGKTLKSDNIEVTKKEHHASNQSINLNLVDTNKIEKSDNFKHSDHGFKYFISYKDDNITRPFCIILPQISGYIKYFENGGKTCRL